MSLFWNAYIKLNLNITYIDENTLENVSIYYMFIYEEYFWSYDIYFWNIAWNFNLEFCLERKVK